MADNKEDKVTEESEVTEDNKEEKKGSNFDIALLTGILVALLVLVIVIFFILVY